MSATLCEEPRQVRSEVSLGQLLTRAREEVHAHGVADCPVCGGDLAPREFEARCDDCGSRLS